MIDLFLSNNRVAVFLEQRKIQITANTRRAFQLLEASISSVSGQIATFWLKDFVNTSLKNILEDNVSPEACKVNILLRNVGYNNSSTQNQNVFQPIARNLLSISPVNIKLANESIRP